MARPILPTYQDTNHWDVVMQAAIFDVSDRADAAAAAAAAAQAASSSGVAGYLNFDSFTGATDTDKMNSVLSYIATLNPVFRPVIRMSARQYNLTGPFTLVNGLTLEGPQMEREYTATSTFWSNRPSCRISTSSASGYFWGMPGAAGTKSYVGSISMKNIHWDGGNQGHDFIQAYTALPCPILSLSTFAHSGWTNYRKPFENIVQANNIFDFHFQSNASSAIYWQGADSTIGVVGMHQFIDHEGPGLPAIRLGLDASFVSGLYLTPSDAGCAIQFDRGTGTIFTSNNFDSAAQQGTSGMCRGSLIQLRGGSTQWTGTRLFGAMYSPSTANGGTAQNQGYITASGGSHILNGVSFETAASRGSVDYTPPGTPHVYATSGVDRVVMGPAMVPGGNPILKQQVAGKFIFDMSAFASIG